MKIAGIIAEYNPLHTGHAYHIKATREKTNADYIIVALSGDFIQRGEPACLSKHRRARAALLAGADLVFELPATHACQSAELFARSAVELLDGLGCVDTLSFGSESGDLAPFLSLGELLATEPPRYRQLLRMYLKEGLSYPAARQRAILSYYDSCPPQMMEALLSAPNNILGLEYCKAIRRIGSTIQPFTIARAGSGYHDTELSGQHPSASALRSFYQKNRSLEPMRPYLPSAVHAYLRADDVMKEFLVPEDFSLLIRFLLFQEKDLEAFMDIHTDLARRILRERSHYENLDQFVSILKTKEITYTRLMRALFHALLEIRDCPPLPYARLLGFRKSASCVLREIKQHSTLPLITKLADAPSCLNAPALQILKENTRISNLYETVLCEKIGKPFVHEYQKELILLP